MPASLRECGCPEWVLRCAHWDGQILLITHAVGSEHDIIHTCNRRFPDDASRHVVYLGREYEPCGATAECPAVCLRIGTAEELANCTSLPEAEAEFARRERILLGWEEE